MPKKVYKTDIKTLLSHVNEAQTVHEGWRKDAWIAAEFLDGKQWNASDIQRLKDKGISELTINRVFPILNLLHGHYINNQTDIVAKGRTKSDNEMGQVMSEGIQFVIDQSHGQMRMNRAFKHQITTGFCCISVGHHYDPRKEKIALRSHQWYSVWWDPYADSPWMDKDDCRYSFTAEWSDLSDLIALFPSKKVELKEQFQHLSTDYYVPDIYDEGTQVEDYKKYLSSGHWVSKSSERERVRPIEMWYTRIEKGFFAIMPNGRIIDIDTVGDENAQYQIVMQAKEVVTANVKKMRVAIFLSDLLLQDIATPYIHDEYPFVPFIGYTDRYDLPFGVVQQIKEQQVEVNKRRSIALSLLSSRRVKMEKGAAEDEQRIYNEANRQDGFLIMKKGKLNAIDIEEMSNLAPAQMDMLMQSEREIQEISGANDDSLGYDSPSRSGVALEQKKQSSATITASLLENAKYSQLLLGERVAALIQDDWTDEKVLRVTDRVTGAEKFISINERYFDGTSHIVKNNITQANFDLKISSKPMTDTMREKNSELIFAAINKAPPEAVGPLLNLALELSDIPNKDLLLQQVRQATGVSNIDDDLTQEERDIKNIEEAIVQQQQQEKETVQQDTNIQLEQDKTNSEIELNQAKAAAELAKANASKQDVDQKGWAIGNQAAQQARNNQMEEQDSNYKTRSDSSHSKIPSKGKDKNPAK